jgi:L-lysine exporter family protein LysE/ArgO
MQAFLHGVILAFGLILPLGVQNVFIFQQGASQRSLWRALPAVLTAGLCDTLLILLAVLGVSLVVLQLAWLQTILYLAGFVFLLYMGWMTWKSRKQTVSPENRGSLSAKRQIAFAASVSLLNPHAILDTIGVIGTNSLAYQGITKATFSIACILVSWVWFLGLGVAGRVIGTLDRTGRWMVWLNTGSALIIWTVALYMGQMLLRS